MWWKVLFISIISILCLSNVATAGRVWVKTPIEIDGEPIYSEHCALAMRSGNTWPVVSYGDYESYTAAMTPVGWMPGPGTGYINYGISAASSASGTAGFAYDNGSVVMLSPGGWSTSYYGGYTNETRPSIAFNNNGTPAVLHNTGGYGNDLTLALFNGYGWYQDVLNDNGYTFNSDAFALEYDSYNQANVAFRDGGWLMFAMKGALTQNQWEFDVVDSEFWGGAVDMAMGSGDVPWITYSNDDYLYYATYDRQQQEWVNGILGQLGYGEGCFSMAADSTGGIGVAYIGAGDMLTFAYTDGSGWSYDIGIAEADSYRDVGLAFDADDNPVICYSDYEGGLSLAYDPQVVPEPATMMLLAIGAVISSRWRKLR